MKQKTSQQTFLERIDAQALEQGVELSITDTVSLDLTLHSSEMTNLIEAEGLSLDNLECNIVQINNPDIEEELMSPDPSSLLIEFGLTMFDEDVSTYRGLSGELDGIFPLQIRHNVATIVPFALPVFYAFCSEDENMRDEADKLIHFCIYIVGHNIIDFLSAHQRRDEIIDEIKSQLPAPEKRALVFVRGYGNKSTHLWRVK